jgi:osmotically inducible protein OsmC
MATRKATAEWQGGLKGGSGNLAVGSGVYDGPYSFKSRFEDDEPTATNPEEMIGAAHAGCYSMQVASMLEAAGTPADSVRTVATVELRVGDEGAHIRSIHLSTTGRVPGIDGAKFQETAEAAKAECIVTRALAGVGEITLDASLES